MESEPIRLEDIPTAPEPLFDKELEIQDTHIAAIWPGKIPDKHTISMQRNAYLKKLIENLGPLRAYILCKYLEKLFLDKEEGIISALKFDASEEFERKHGSKAEVDGVIVNTRGHSFYVYPKEVLDMEDAVRDMTLKLKGMKKAAEIDGSATKYQSEERTLTITFKG